MAVSTKASIDRSVNEDTQTNIPLYVAALAPYFDANEPSGWIAEGSQPPPAPAARQ